MNYLKNIWGMPAYTGKIIKSVRKIGDYYQVIVAGVLIAEDDQNFNEEGHWEAMDCDIIIPRQKDYIIKPDSNLRHARLHQVMHGLKEFDLHFMEKKL